MTEKTLTGKVQIELSDAISGQVLNLIQKDSLTQLFSCNPSATEIVSYSFFIPDSISSLQHKITASTGEFSDGEQRWLPVLSRKILVTETMPLWLMAIRPIVRDEKLTGNVSTTLKQHQLTLETAANPSWYAIQSLPYLAKPTNACIEQQFNAFMPIAFRRGLLTNIRLLARCLNAGNNRAIKKPSYRLWIKIPN
jgi:hypothetical protein